MKASDFKRGMPVLYVPLHANGDPTHQDVEPGIVSSVNEYFVFVKFEKHLFKHGWHGSISEYGWDATTSQGCDPDSLLIRDMDHTGDDR